MLHGHIASGTRPTRWQEIQKWKETLCNAIGCCLAMWNKSAFLVAHIRKVDEAPVWVRSSMEYIEEMNRNKLLRTLSQAFSTIVVENTWKWRLRRLVISWKYFKIVIIYIQQLGGYLWTWRIKCYERRRRTAMHEAPTQGTKGLCPNEHGGPVKMEVATQ